MLPAARPHVMRSAARHAERLHEPVILRSSCGRRLRARRVEELSQRPRRQSVRRRERCCRLREVVLDALEFRELGGDLRVRKLAARAWRRDACAPGFDRREALLDEFLARRIDVEVVEVAGSWLAASRDADQRLLEQRHDGSSAGRARDRCAGQRRAARLECAVGVHRSSSASRASALRAASASRPRWPSARAPRRSAAAVRRRDRAPASSVTTWKRSRSRRESRSRAAARSCALRARAPASRVQRCARAARDAASCGRAVEQFALRAARASDWNSCWPWMSTSSSPTARRVCTGTCWPLR